MARRAPALVISALALVAGCGLGDGGPAAEPSPPPLVTHQAPDGGSAGGGGPDSSARPTGPCVEVADLTVAHPASGTPAQVVPDCSDREAPVPFTVPRHPPTPGRLGAL